MNTSVTIDNHKIGDGQSTFIIAEMSANHNQDFDKAANIIKEARKAGADAVKLQAYRPDTLTIDCNNKYFQVKHPKWKGQTLYELYKRAYTPWGWFERLKKIADEQDITFLCTAFDRESIDFLEELDICAHKISSFELVDLPLIAYVAKTKKPLIISTGMADICEIQEAISTASNNGAEEIILLKCVSSYPAKPENMNLKTIPHMKELFNCPVGLSDHSLGITASICAAALGANAIEKHFTLSRMLNTPDSFFSVEPEEFKQLVEHVRIAEKASGDTSYEVSEEEKDSRVFRRSLFVVKDMKAGELFTEENLRSIRPGNGLPPKFVKDILGKKAKQDIRKGTPLKWNLVSVNEKVGKT